MKIRSGHWPILLIVLVTVICSACNGNGTASETEVNPVDIPTTTASEPATMEEHTFLHNHRESVYYLRIPAGLDLSQPAPAIFIFHGMGDTPQSMFKAGFGPIADEEKIILVYPELISHTSTDFIQQLYLDVGETASLDPDRAYAMGFSYGGMLTYYTACDLPETFAAFAAVAGMAICENGHASDRAVPIMHIHGLGDDLVDYHSGGYGMPPVEEAMAYWLQFNECSSSPQTEINGKITHKIYAPCREGAVMELYTIEGLGHKVPTKEMSSAKTIWEFFKNHPRPE